ncbi:hypothetical protein H2203_008902 [Taxawa tesnikishii (nom. ined.)]|nr:hypothetical protein H2203_008902 [Dothideales sp. JES 119]
MEHQFPLYTYQTLDNHKDIRLLRILPGGFHEAIRCELSIKKGEEQYEALSYTWGLAESTDFIIIQAGRESRSFNVTPNLYAGLRRLRREREPRAIWVDAICINQRNDQERNNQVSMMFSIYTGASSVCVWLGEAANDSQLAIRFIDEILEIGGFEDLVNRPDCVPRWKALKELMTRDWFTRRWVVQEIALARRAILHCGEDSVEWSDFADAVGLFGVRNHNISKAIKASAMYDHNPDLLGDLRALGATQLVEHTRNLFRKKDDGTIVENLLDLTTLVSRLTPFQAKQPHDTIYAVLSLARDAIPKPPDGVPEEAPTLTDAQKKKLGSFVKAWKNKAQNKAYHYMVDYKKDFFGVCRDFLEWTLSKSARLDILCHPWAPASQESVDKGKQKRVRKWDQSDSDDEDDGDVPTPMTARSSDNRDRANSQVSAADSVIDGQASAGATRDDSDANHATNGQTNGRPNYANGHGSIGAVGKRPRDDSVPSWIPTLSGGPWGKNDEGHYTRVQADPLVGGAATYRASGNTTASYALVKARTEHSMLTDSSLTKSTKRPYRQGRLDSYRVAWICWMG